MLRLIMLKVSLWEANKFMASNAINKGINPAANTAIIEVTDGNFDQTVLGSDQPRILTGFAVLLKS